MTMEQLKQMIEFLDIHAGSLTFIVTFVYVIATIFICIANIRSAKATREQVAEQKRQFDESNRAYVTVHFEVTPSKLYTLCVCNHGNKVAKNVHLEISDEFIEELTDELKENDKVSISNFGTFTKTLIKAKNQFSPIDGSELNNSYYRITFTCSKDLINKLKNK